MGPSKISLLPSKSNPPPPYSQQPQEHPGIQIHTSRQTINCMTFYCNIDLNPEQNCAICASKRIRGATLVESTVRDPCTPHLLSFHHHHHHHHPGHHCHHHHNHHHFLHHHHHLWHAHHQSRALLSLKQSLISPPVEPDGFVWRTVSLSS